MSVAHLWRYAVKGLDRDELLNAPLTPGSGFPSDRQWALHYEDGARFHPVTPVWLHKSNFKCAFNAADELGKFETSFDDETSVLTVRSRSGTPCPTNSWDLTKEADRARAAAFFSEVHGRPLRLVQADGAHHFGNTPAGFKHHPSGSIIHIVNTSTVEALGETALGSKQALHPSRFRPNMVLTGVPAWSEFDWVGRRVRIGGATLEVVKRTVRCEATNVDCVHGSGRADLDVPGLLAKHFPQHGPYLGVYAIVAKGGTVHVGDPVTPMVTPEDEEGCAAASTEKGVSAAVAAVKAGRLSTRTAALLVTLLVVAAVALVAAIVEIVRIYQVLPR